MRKIALSILTPILILFMSTSWAWDPDPNNKMELDVKAAILDISSKDPGIEAWFTGAAGYAAFPKVGKGAIGIGGAHGKGLVISGDQVVGTTSLSQISVGLALGGQVYAEFIFFRDTTALDDFKRGNYEMGAHASAVLATAGAAADANYNDGVAIFKNTGSGLTFEASVGGQKFKFTAK